MEKSTLNLIRKAYYIGIVLLVINALPLFRGLVGWLFSIPLPIGMSMIELVAILTAIGAGFSYTRRYI